MGSGAKSAFTVMAGCVAAGAFPAFGAELLLACTVREVPSDEPYAFSIVMDPEKQAILSVDGDLGVPWVMDRFDASQIAAHYDFGNQRGTLVIDRITATIDTTTLIRVTPQVFLQQHGTCAAASRKF